METSTRFNRKRFPAVRDLYFKFFQIIYPTDTRGNICGRGELKDRPYLLFFDLTRCLNPAVLVSGCPTEQVCVAKCPDKMYSGWAAYKSGLAQSNIKEVMRPTCVKMPNEEWDKLSVEQLFEDNICPAWVLPSTNVIGTKKMFLLVIHGFGNNCCMRAC